MRTEKWESNQEIGKHEWRRAVQTIGALFDECSPVFEKRRHICYSHETHKCRSEELEGQPGLPYTHGEGQTYYSVDERLDMLLCRSHANPYSAHHNCQTYCLSALSVLGVLG